MADWRNAPHLSLPFWLLKCFCTLPDKPYTLQEDYLGVAMRSLLHVFFCSRRLLLLCCLFITSPLVSAVDATMVIKYVNRGDLDHRHNFKYKLIDLILESTVREYGAYRIEPYPNDPGAHRLAVLVNEGEIVNLLWASPGTVISRADVIGIPFDVMQGLLGKRMCLVNGAHEELFKTAIKKNSLSGISIGQGLGWPDTEIYKTNNIPIIEAPTFEGLVNMLGFNRFDCLALSAFEIVATYQEKLKIIPTLEIEKSLLIRYDFPVYFYVSAKYPKIAARINLGLKKLIANGKFKKLFDHYYYKQVQELNLAKRHEICLKSPFQPLAQQCN